MEYLGSSGRYSQAQTLVKLILIIGQIIYHLFLAEQEVYHEVVPSCNRQLDRKETRAILLD
jgi:hypothetical protein